MVLGRGRADTWYRVSVLRVSNVGHGEILGPEPGSREVLVYGATMGHDMRWRAAMCWRVGVGNLH
jgi:hypothetical protein